MINSGLRKLSNSTKLDLIFTQLSFKVLKFNRARCNTYAFYNQKVLLIWNI